MREQINRIAEYLELRGSYFNDEMGFWIPTEYRWWNPAHDDADTLDLALRFGLTLTLGGSRGIQVNNKWAASKTKAALRCLVIEQVYSIITGDKSNEDQNA